MNDSLECKYEKDNRLQLLKGKREKINDTCFISTRTSENDTCFIKNNKIFSIIHAQTCAKQVLGVSKDETPLV